LRMVRRMVLGTPLRRGFEDGTADGFGHTPEERV
jgi:hypothetical protein